MPIELVHARMFAVSCMRVTCKCGSVRVKLRWSIRNYVNMCTQCHVADIVYREADIAPWLPYHRKQKQTWRSVARAASARPLAEQRGSAGTVMGDRLRVGIPPRYVTSHIGQRNLHPGQLSLLPSVGREMSTGQSTVMLCGWVVKAGWLIPFVDKRVGGR